MLVKYSERPWKAQTHNIRLVTYNKCGGNRDNMKAYIMIGHIGSGKSSWSQMMAGMDQSLIRISHDDIRKMIKDRYVYVVQYESLVDAFTETMVREAILKGFNVIIDDCHLTKESRLRICRFIHTINPKMEIIYVWVKGNIEEGLQRRINEPYDYVNPDFVWHQVSKRHKAIFQRPYLGENEYSKDMIVVQNAKSN